MSGPERGGKHSGEIAPWSIVIVLVLSACSASSEAGPAAAEKCTPSITEAEPLLPIEVAAASSPDFEVWALIFNSWQIGLGDPLRLPVGREIKIVWRATGEGEVSFSASGPRGETLEPIWGPDRHLGSNWNRPGDEWGTGWQIPVEGCWSITVERGGARATVSATVFADEG